MFIDCITAVGFNRTVGFNSSKDLLWVCFPNSSSILQGRVYDSKKLNENKAITFSWVIITWQYVQQERISLMNYQLM